jgi:hypothetical protein
MIYSIIQSWSDELYISPPHFNTINSIVGSWAYHHDIEPLPFPIFGTSILDERRRLKAVWSREAVEDLRAFHNIDAEAELTAIIKHEINREIDREIIADLRDVARDVAQQDNHYLDYERLVVAEEQIFGNI